MPKFMPEDYKLAYEMIDRCVRCSLEVMWPTDVNWFFWMPLVHSKVPDRTPLSWEGYEEASIPCPFGGDRLRRAWRRGFVYGMLGNNCTWIVLERTKPELRHAWLHGFVVADMSKDNSELMTASMERYKDGLWEIQKELDWMVSHGMVAREYDRQDGAWKYRKCWLPVLRRDHGQGPQQFR